MPPPLLANYAVKAGVVCWQVKLWSTPEPERLQARFSRRGATQIHHLYLIYLVLAKETAQLTLVSHFHETHCKTLNFRVHINFENWVAKLNTRKFLYPQTKSKLIGIEYPIIHCSYLLLTVNNNSNVVSVIWCKYY